MSKMIIMQGLPASGKSTRAKEIVEAEGNTVRINKDLLRTMLHFDKFTGKNEGATRDAARVLAKHFLSLPHGGANVVVDDTNLNPGTLQSWKDLAKEVGAKIQYERIETPYHICLQRDRDREKHVGDHVITGMALQYGFYPKPDKGVVLCDLDGTLCDIKHRLPFVKNIPEGGKKDWKSFFAAIPKDKVRQDVLEMVQGYASKGHQIFFVSARPDTYRGPTEKWLFENYAAPYAGLIMRPGHDSRDDELVKGEMYDKYFSKFPTEAVIDDRPRVIRMWRAKGLNVIDVGAGVEF